MISGYALKDWRDLAARFVPGSLEQGDIANESRQIFERLVVVDGAVGDYAAVMTQITFAMMWGRCGFPHVIIRPQRAAYFATTQIKPGCENLFLPPWPAFFISLVDSELMTDENGRDAPVTGIMAWSCIAEAGDEAVLRGLCRVGDRCWSYAALTAKGTCIFRSKYAYNWSSSDASGDSWDDLPTNFGVGQSERDLRLNLLIAQLIAGMCLEFQASPETRELSRRRAKGKTARQTLRKYVSATNMPYVLGEDVVVDARRVVSEYHKHGGRSPTVRSFVRPHPRNQRYGPGNSLVKVIRVEGFWRGALGAPIRARTHKWSGG